MGSIIKGESGSPGELMGIIDYLPENEIGTITKNTEHGIFGEGNEALLEAASMNSYPTAMKQEIGCRENATSTSLAQCSLKCCRTQATTMCFSGASARRVTMPALPGRSYISRESGSA